MLLGLKIAIALIFVSSATYVHLRGKVRFRLGRQITDYSTFIAPLNTFVYLFSGIGQKSVVDADAFPGLSMLRENWQTIRDEALALEDDGQIKVAEGYQDLAFNSFFKRGWKRFYFKWYGEYLPSGEELCPQTVALLKEVPNLKAAMITRLNPGSNLGKHRDPYAGSLRYHLGLKTPNSPDCRIYIDGEAHHWMDGEHILFDETYIHEVKNETDQDRVILMCDIERPMKFRWASAINRLVGRILGPMTATKNVPGEKVGILNRIFGFFYRISKAGQKLKQLNRRLYYALKYTVILALLYWIFFA